MPVRSYSSNECNCIGKSLRNYYFTFCTELLLFWSDKTCRFFIKVMRSFAVKRRRTIGRSILETPLCLSQVSCLHLLSWRLRRQLQRVACTEPEIQHGPMQRREKIVRSGIHTQKFKDKIKCANKALCIQFKMCFALLSTTQTADSSRIEAF